MQDIGETIMIINPERNPTISLYYMGSIVLEILLNKDNISIENLYEATQMAFGHDLHIDFFYYTLDWLYLISAVNLNEERVYLCE